MINPMELTGKHVLITGASSGIGRAACILASQLGAKVSMIARSEEGLLQTKAEMEGTGHPFYILDLTQLDKIEDLVKQIAAQQGPVDGFVHCAGITKNCPVSLTKTDSIDAMMRTNFYAFAEFIRVMAKRKYSNKCASFVGISSVAALCGDKAQGAYAASKAAMNGFIHPAAKELAERSIRVNTIAFGMIKTRMYYEDFLEIGGDTASLEAGQYLGVGELADAANAICFLLSDASKFITGTTLVADGGNLS